MVLEAEEWAARAAPLMVTLSRADQQYAASHGWCAPERPSPCLPPGIRADVAALPSPQDVSPKPPVRPPHAYTFTCPCPSAPHIALRLALQNDCPPVLPVPQPCPFSHPFVCPSAARDAQLHPTPRRTGSDI